MLYQTMIFEMLQEIPALYRELQQRRTLLTTLNLYATLLRDRHQAWEQQLILAKPTSSRQRIASQALEIALKEIQDRLLAGSPMDDAGAFNLDAAMAFIQAHTPPA